VVQLSGVIVHERIHVGDLTTQQPAMHRVLVGERKPLWEWDLVQQTPTSVLHHALRRGCIDGLRDRTHVPVRAGLCGGLILVREMRDLH
jgi:hypothetical protein